MPRSGDDARRRLQGAALELWSQHGYEAVTTAEIAARAGVTPRTFFRHFPDKREVLFDSAATMSGILRETVAAAPSGLTPLELVRCAFTALAPLFEPNRPFVALRHSVIAQTPALRERELAKGALLTEALAAALAARGIAPRRAALAAQTSMAAFNHAFEAWAQAPGESFDAHIAQAFDELESLVSRG